MNMMNETFMALAVEEQEINVNVSETKQFTESNVATLVGLRNLSAHPRIYGSRAPAGINYLRTQLIDVEDVFSDNEDYEQLSRVSVNPEYKAIGEDIRINGYSLAELPIFVMELPNDKFIILEGRTRFGELRKMGVKNIIADVFANTDECSALRFATAMNAQKKPYGAASLKDIRKTILELVKRGAIDREAPNFRDLVLVEIKEITNKLTVSQEAQIVHDAVDLIEGIPSVKSFPDGRGAKEWLTRNGYTDSAETVYIPVSAYKEKLFSVANNNDRKLPSTVTDIRLVIHGGTLDARNPEKGWLDKVKDFDRIFENYLEDISRVFFGEARPKMGRVRVYGCIPQCKTLDDKYPLDKLYVY